MMLGKRHRPPMKRTTSMSEITFDLNTITDDVDPNNPLSRQGPGGGGGGGVGVVPYAPAAAAGGSEQSRVLATVSPRNNHTRHFSTDSAHTPHFLRACFLCKRRLVPGRDIYMYRGDSAFCSLECRQQQMNQDDKKDKCCVASKKQVVVVAPPSGSHSTKGETVVATKS